jgi:uncharacterized protein (DUF427 family)
LASHPAAANYQIEGPENRLFFEDFPRRVRAVFAGKTVFDSRRGKLLHETGLLPQLYVPRADVRFDLFEESEHSTHCPYKGNARYWSLRVGERVAENAAWAYPQPFEAAAWLDDYMAFYWRALDAWFDEDEEVVGHLCDPYHRVDVRRTSRRIRVSAEGETVAESARTKILSETGLPNRYYIPPADVRWAFLESSTKRTVCPHKGRASYYSLRLGEHGIPDAAWCYPEPLEEAFKVGGHLCFLAEGVTTEVDGEPLA